MFPRLSTESGYLPAQLDLVVEGDSVTVLPRLSTESGYLTAQLIVEGTERGYDAVLLRLPTRTG